MALSTGSEKPFNLIMKSGVQMDYSRRWHKGKKCHSEWAMPIPSQLPVMAWTFRLRRGREKISSSISLPEPVWGVANHYYYSHPTRSNPHHHQQPQGSVTLKPSRSSLGSTPASAADVTRKFQFACQRTPFSRDEDLVCPLFRWSIAGWVTFGNAGWFSSVLFEFYL